MSARTLQIHGPAIPTAQGQPALVPVRLSGREGLNALFTYELLLKTPDALNPDASGAADFDLDGFIGREIGCRIELEGSAPRQINALVTGAAMRGQEGRHIQYGLTLRPWLHLATLRTDCRIFQDRTPIDILDELLAGYGFPVDKRLIGHYPARDFQTQFNESDFDFFSRLCQEWGISYHFAHADGTHRLVLSDAMGAYPAQGGAYREVDYHAPGWTLDAEYIHRFVPEHRLASGRYATRDHDYTRPRADLGTGCKDPRPTGWADGEVYQWHHPAAGSHYAQPRAGSAPANDPQDEGRLLALLRMQALRTDGARAQASGNLRGMVPGCTFRLAGHPRTAANAEYLVLETRLHIEDVAQDSQNREAVDGRAQHWRVSVDFTVHPATQPLRPALVRSKPHSRGPQVALVVGPEGQNLWTDALGRIKVQFPWDRSGANNPHSSCWLRVGSPWAGNRLGGVHLPRIGQEVIVSFIGGDPDLPVCTGRVHNQMNLPPWALPGQAALSGFRSRELTQTGGNSAAGRSNHLLLDDTEGRIQAQLKSDHRSSSLSLGFITRVEDNAGRKDPRGEGFELRTDGHGVLRARHGLLVTTEARANASAHAKDMGETTARLRAAQAQHQGLAEAAATARVQREGEDQALVAQALKAQNDAIEGRGGDKAQGHFSEFDDPQLVLASAAGIAATTTGSLHLQAGEHIAIGSQGHTSLSAAKRLLVSAKEGIRLFALRGGMKWIAGNDKVQIRADKDKIGLAACKAVRITSTTSEIILSAPKKVVVNGGGSFTEWSRAGILHGTPGGWVEHAGSHVKVGPASLPLAPVNHSACAGQSGAAATEGAGSMSR